MGDNEESELLRLFGRLEGKIDRIVEQVGHIGERLAGHDVRLSTVEREIAELKNLQHDERHTQTTGRQALIASVSGGATGSLVAVVATFLGHH